MLLDRHLAQQLKIVGEIVTSVAACVEHTYTLPQAPPWAPEKLCFDNGLVAL